MKNQIQIRPLIEKDIAVISDAFNKIGWNKPESLFEGYLKEQEVGERLVWVAYTLCHPRKNGEPVDSRLRGNDNEERKNDSDKRGNDNEERGNNNCGSVNDSKKVIAGYVTLKWQSQYPSFKEQNIPEIMDLNVLPHCRKMGIGSLLLDAAEKEAITRSDTIGIGVGLYAGEDGGYGSAQRLYVKRGYTPDGKGVAYNYQPTIPGNSYPLDDDLVLWFMKKLKRDL